MSPLTAEARAHFATHGWCPVPGAASPEQCRRALRAIHMDLGQEGLPPDELPRYRHRSFCPDLRVSAAICDLYTETALRPAAEDLIGAGQVAPPFQGQIALRFPDPEDKPPDPAHLDGMPNADNGLEGGHIRTFSLLAGVYLEDVTGPDQGNFTVWPGTHLTFAAYFRAHGPTALLRGLPDVPMPAPVPVTGRAGDGFLCHYQVAHAAALNLGHRLRYACFFRLVRRDHADHAPAQMSHPWWDYLGLFPDARATP